MDLLDLSEEVKQVESLLTWIPEILSSVPTTCDLKLDEPKLRKDHVARQMANRNFEKNSVVRFYLTDYDYDEDLENGSSNQFEQDYDNDDEFADDAGAKEECNLNLEDRDRRQNQTPRWVIYLFGKFNIIAKAAYIQNFSLAMDQLTDVQKLLENLTGVHKERLLSVGKYTMDALEWQVSKMMEISGTTLIGQNCKGCGCKEGSMASDNKLKELREKWNGFSNDKKTKAVLMFWKVLLEKNLLPVTETEGKIKDLELLREVIKMDPDYYVWYHYAYKTKRNLRFLKTGIFDDTCALNSFLEEAQWCKKELELAPEILPTNYDLGVHVKDSLKSILSHESRIEILEKCVTYFDKSLALAEKFGLKYWIQKIKIEEGEALVRWADNKDLVMKGLLMMQECVEVNPAHAFLHHKLAKIYHYGVKMSNDDWLFRNPEKAQKHYHQALKQKARLNFYNCLEGYLKLLPHISPPVNPEEVMELLTTSLATFESLHKSKITLTYDKEKAFIIMWRACTMWQDNEKREACNNWISVLKSFAHLPKVQQQLVKTIWMPPFSRGKESYYKVSTEELIVELENIKAENVNEEDTRVVVDTILEKVKTLDLPDVVTKVQSPLAWIHNILVVKLKLEQSESRQNYMSRKLGKNNNSEELWGSLVNSSDSSTDDDNIDKPIDREIQRKAMKKDVDAEATDNETKVEARLRYLLQVPEWVDNLTMNLLSAAKRVYIRDFNVATRRFMETRSFLNMLTEEHRERLFEVGKYMLDALEWSLSTMRNEPNSSNDLLKCSEESLLKAQWFQEEWERLQSSNKCRAFILFLRGYLDKDLLPSDGKESYLESLKNAINLDPQYQIWYHFAYTMSKKLRRYGDEKRYGDDRHKHRDPSEEEMQWCKKQIELAPENLLANADFGLLLKEKLGMKKQFGADKVSAELFEGCLRHYNKAVQLAEEHGLRHWIRKLKIEKGELLVYQGNDEGSRDEGMNLLHDCLKETPTDSYVHQKLANIYQWGIRTNEGVFLLQDRSKAEEHFRQALDRKKHDNYFSCLNGYMKLLPYLRPQPSPTEVLKLLTGSMEIMYSFDINRMVKNQMAHVRTWRACLLWNNNPEKESDHATKACKEWISILKNESQHYKLQQEILKSIQKPPFSGKHGSYMYELNYRRLSMKLEKVKKENELDEASLAALNVLVKFMKSKNTGETATVSDHLQRNSNTRWGFRNREEQNVWNNGSRAGNRVGDSKADMDDNWRA